LSLAARDCMHFPGRIYKEHEKDTHLPRSSEFDDLPPILVDLNLLLRLDRLFAISHTTPHSRHGSNSIHSKTSLLVYLHPVLVSTHDAADLLVEKIRLETCS
jgi:hypothetical protein